MKKTVWVLSIEYEGVEQVYATKRKAIAAMKRLNDKYIKDGCFGDSCFAEKYEVIQ